VSGNIKQQIAIRDGLTADFAGSSVRVLTLRNHFMRKRRFCILLLTPPYIFLILGVVSISAAAVFTCTGKVWVRFNDWVYRAKEPRWFWWEATLDYLIGICFMGYFLYMIYGH